jgi:hypothetical protein
VQKVHSNTYSKKSIVSSVSLMSDSSENNLFLLNNQNIKVNESRGVSRKKIFDEKKISPNPNTKTVSPNPGIISAKNLNLDN